LVDGFAGPGKFEDGEVGSPLILCAKVQKQLARYDKVAVLCIEPDDELFSRLSKNMKAFPFATCKHGTFSQHLGEIESRATSHTVFLYLDPFTVEGLEWAALDRLFQKVKAARMSIELLLNFNAAAFVRRALAASNLEVPVIDPMSEDPEEIDIDMPDPPSVGKLCAVVGGDWWQQSLKTSRNFCEQVRLVSQGICERLRSQFEFVGRLSIKQRERHLIPKYYFVFASRHPDGFTLMNDAMVKTRKDSVFFTDLFAVGDLRNLVLELADKWIARRDLILGVIGKAFCTYSWSEIRGVTEGMLKSKALISETGKKRINNEVRVRRAEATG